MRRDGGLTHFLYLVKLTGKSAHFASHSGATDSITVPRGGITYPLLLTPRDPELVISHSEWIDLGRPGRLHLTLEGR